MSRIGYWAERGYPYAFGGVAVLTCLVCNINISNSNNYKELLNGLITLGSIIIGFLGAILPTVLGLRNESKFVKYVFRYDTENLFAKYLKATIFLGLSDILISLVMHVRNSFSLVARNVLYYLWIFISITFIVATYRSMSHMIALVFFNEKEEIENFEKSKVSSERKREIEDEYRAR